MNPEGVGFNSSKAPEWRDLSEQEIFNERALRIGLAVGAIILAIGMAVAIYYCCTTTHTFTDQLGELIEDSNAFLSILPGVFGSVGLITLIFFVAVTNFEVSDNGRAPEDTPESRAAKKLQMQTNTLEGIYKHYYRKNGGLGPLVRPSAGDANGILTPEQGNQLRTLLSNYHPNHKITSEFEKFNKGETLSSQGKDTVYGMANGKKAEFEEQWKVLQKDIKFNAPEGL